ncbi:unnamed protein product [Parnassius apollo]|uniref:(apollo) hypothetical protein n=1 Tax=Parnassius apollo TaxID=110799 RepID=A0A8S3W712_PARAO|nr:unnamed protein product [Parnassius apollo]
MLVTYLEASRDLCETDSILFGAALAVCRIIGAKVSTAGRATGHSSAIPAWRRRIEERIAKARALIGRLICFRSGNNRPRIVRTVRMACAGTNVSLSQPDITQKLTERIDDLKQRIAAWGKRIRRYTERSTRFNQNRLFQSDQKRLYESLERPMVSGTGPARNQADTVAFWRGLWSEPVNHSEGPWTEVVASQCAGITPMDPVIITPDDVAEAVRRAPNWKSPGLEGLHHYRLKGFMGSDDPIARGYVTKPLLQRSQSASCQEPRKRKAFVTIAKGLLEEARARLELELDATACKPPANEREVLHDHPAAPRIHHLHQLAWCRLGLRGPSNRHPPLVEHAACVGQLK